MTLLDHENGRDIINPYITLYEPKEYGWVALNTETFREAQEELIHIYDEETFSRLAFDEKRALYPVSATVGKLNHYLDWARRSYCLRNVRVSGASDAVALIPLGYLLEDVVQRLFPRSMSYFEKIRLELRQKRDISLIGKFQS